MINFLSNISDFSNRHLLSLFDKLAVLDVIKTPVSKIRDASLLWIATLREVMNQIESRQLLFRPPVVVACADMTAKLVSSFSLSEDSDLTMFSLLLSNEPIVSNFAEKEIPPFLLRKLVKIHSYSPLFAFICHHFPKTKNIKDLFCYAFCNSMERNHATGSIPTCLPTFPADKYKLPPLAHIHQSDIKPNRLLEISRSLECAADPLMILLVRHLSISIFGPMEFGLIKVPELVDTILGHLEENPDFEIENMTRLLLYLSSNPVNIPVHLTYTPVNHCMFFIGLALTGHFEPTASDILIQTLSFENAPCPSLSLVFAHNLNTPFITDFVAHAMTQQLSESWNKEINHLSVYVKLPPKREDYVESAKTNNIDAIKKLLVDPECLPLLNPDKFLSHRLLKLFIEPIPPLPENFEVFDRYNSALIYRISTMKELPSIKIVCGYLKSVAREVDIITDKLCKGSKPLVHAVYSGMKLTGVSPTPSAYRFNNPDDFFAQPSGYPFEDVSIVVENLLIILTSSQYRIKKDKTMLKLVADLSIHSLLVLSDHNRGNKIFGNIYQEIVSRQPIIHLLAALDEQDVDKAKLVELFKPILSTLKSQSNLIYLLKKLQLKNDDITFAKVLQICPNVNLIGSFDSANLLKIVKIIFPLNMCQIIANIAEKFIADNAADDLFAFLVAESIENPITLNNVCQTLKDLNEFAKYFFEHFPALPKLINHDFAGLLITLSKQLKNIPFESETYPKLQPPLIEWREDLSQSLDNEDEDSSDFLDVDLPIREIPYSTEDEPSIWEIPRITHCTYIDSGPHYVIQPFFRCATCRLSSNEGVCEYCAIHCHKGHKLYYDVRTECFCDCFQNADRCVSNPRHPLSVAPTSTSTMRAVSFGSGGMTKKSERSFGCNHIHSNVVLQPQTAANVFLSLCGVEFNEVNDFISLSLRQLKSVKYLNQYKMCSPFTPHSSPSASLLKKRFARHKPQQLDRRTTCRDIDVVCALGDDVFCYSNGSVITAAFINQLDKHFNYNVDSIVYSLVPLEDQMVASIGENLIEVISLSKEPLILESVAKITSIHSGRVFYFIDAIFVNKEQIILLSCNSISVRSLPSGEQKSAILSEKALFTSFCLFEYQEHHFVLAGNAEGQLIIYLLSIKEGTLTFDHYVGIERPNIQVLVSYSKQSNLIFISSDKSPLLCCRPADLFSITPNTIKIEGILSPVLYKLNYPGQLNNFFLVTPKNGFLTSFEIKKDLFVISPLNDRAPEGNLPLFEFVPAFLGSFVVGDSLITLLPDGNFMKIIQNDMNKNLLTLNNIFSMSSFDNYNPNIGNDDFALEPEEEVPPTFWSRTIISPPEATLAINGNEDASSLLENRTMAIPSNVALDFTAKISGNANYTIVGIRVFAVLPSSSNLRVIECNNRTYQFNNTLPTCIPLRPDEVQPGGSVTFKIAPNSGMMILRLVNIHCLETSQLRLPQNMSNYSCLNKVKKNFDWMNDCTNLFDFCETSLFKDVQNDDKSQIGLMIARNFENGVKISEETVYRLLLVMYENPKLSLQCRLIVLKSGNDNETVKRLWAKAIREVVVQKRLNEGLAKALWRDFALLNDELREGIQNDIWINAEYLSGISCFVSAFH